MSSYPQIRSVDYIRWTMLHDLNQYQRIVPRIPSKLRIYKPNSTVSTAEASPVFVPLFYAGEKGALGIWDKNSGTGYVKRRLDEEERCFHILELTNPRNNLGTFITSPRSPLQALHITLPYMVLVMKNYRRNFGFDVLVMDSNAYRRRFSFATWYNPSTLKKYSFLCQIPLRLEIGWNEIHINFNELVKNTYKTSYVEVIRMQVYANCKLRQIFFCDDRIMKGEVPIPSMRDFGNIRIIPLDYGPRTHPDGVEPGPEKKRTIPYVDPPTQIAPSRLEQDLKLLQRRRFNEVSKQRLALQPYKTYFRDLLQEEKHKKKLSNAIQAALKQELATKTIKSDDEKKSDGEKKSDLSSVMSVNNCDPADASLSSPSVAPTTTPTVVTLAAPSSSPQVEEKPSKKSLTALQDKEGNNNNVVVQDSKTESSEAK